MPYKKVVVIVLIVFVLIVFIILGIRSRKNIVGTNVVDAILGSGNHDYNLVTFNDFDQFIKDQPGTYSYNIKSEYSSVQYNDQHVFYAASLFKIPVAVATVKYLEQNGVYDISNYPNSIKKEDPGTTEEPLFSPPSFRGSVATEESTQQVLYVKEQLNYLLKDSNNDSQQYFIDLVGFEQIKNAFVALGLNPNGEFFINNKASSSEIITMFENLQTTNYILPENRDYLIELMYQTSFDDRISDHLKPGINYSHKIGNWPDTGNWHDCGLVTGDEQLVICLMSEGVTLDQFKVVGKAFAEYINNL